MPAAQSCRWVRPNLASVTRILVCTAFAAGCPLQPHLMRLQELVSVFADVVEVVLSHLRAAKGQVLVLELRVMHCIASPRSFSFVTSASGCDF